MGFSFRKPSTPLGPRHPNRLPQSVVRRRNGMAHVLGWHRSQLNPPRDPLLQVLLLPRLVRPLWVGDQLRLPKWLMVPRRALRMVANLLVVPPWVRASLLAFAPNLRVGWLVDPPLALPLVGRGRPVQLHL